ncbi:hypothetical protein BGZ63DRAFT_399507 [Mariannaea sp. PMI_226]|nr:hypothetical protein BGZ63DRAFT_399507 [Mariannaea sp. PMI_226]
MASSNPFRRSTGPSINSTGPPRSPATRFPALDAIDTSLPPLGASISNPSSKVIKKVRVLSPPPLSPDSPDWRFTAPPLAPGLLDPTKENDPFDAESPADSDREIMPSATPPPPKDSRNIPANPFSKTLHDMETATPDQKLAKERADEGVALKVANKSRRSLDVNSFKRLLMTGNLGANASSAKTPTLETTRTDANSSSVSFSSSSYGDINSVQMTTQEVSLISRETSDTPDDYLDQGSLSDSSASFHMSQGKKPPPPPSSRHGKSIKLELKGASDSTPILSPKSASDVNKPLPPAPRRSMENDFRSQFEGEPVDKVSEADSLHGSLQSPLSSAKKAGPAPPPRRGHSRGESRSYATNNLKDISKPYGEQVPSRSSSIRSRTERNRHDPYGSIPPPPPPRSHGNSRHSTVLPPEVSPSSNTGTIPISTSPEILTDTETPTGSRPMPSSELTSPRNLQASASRMAAPPPPPTRNTSVRRPASIRSVDGSSRRTSAETKTHTGMAPPPPPRRQRGSSQNSMDAPYSRRSLDGASKSEQMLVGEGGGRVDMDPTSSQSATREGNGVDILADLTALQREVDALRGKLGP